MLRALALSLLLCISAAVLAETPQRLARLQDAARITIDDEGISHVRANNEHDLYFMQGWVHARDRLFQMDYNRRLASTQPCMKYKSCSLLARTCEMPSSSIVILAASCRRARRCGVSANTAALIQSSRESARARSMVVPPLKLLIPR